jgi:hypothetical protein
MVQLTEHTTLSPYIVNLLDNGKTRDEIEADLVEKGHDVKFVKELVQQTSKLRYARMRAHGLTMILIGGVICFLSFLLTITSTFTSSSFSYVLYGLTSVGIIVVFAGFTKVF